MCGELPQEDFNGGLDAGILTRIILFDELEVRKTQGIDRNLFRFKGCQGGVGEYPNLELPVSCFGFGCSCASEDDFLAFQIDTIVISVLTNFEDFG